MGCMVIVLAQMSACMAAALAVKQKCRRVLHSPLPKSKKMRAYDLRPHYKQKDAI